MVTYSADGRPLSCSVFKGSYFYGMEGYGRGGLTLQLGTLRIRQWRRDGREKAKKGAWGGASIFFHFKLCV